MVSDGHSTPERGDQLSERERSRIEGSFGAILVLLIITVFFSISAPDEPWAELATAVVLAITLSITMLASGARRGIVRILLGCAGLGIAASFITLATVGYGDLAPQGGIGRALAVTEGLTGQIYLVTAVAALVSNIGSARASRQWRDRETGRTSNGETVARIKA